MQVKLWLVAVSCGLVGCSWLWWDVHARCMAPDGSTTVTVWYFPVPPDGAVRVGIADNTRATMMTHRSPNDRIPMLVEVGWEMDGRRLGLLVCDGVSSDIVLGYDWGNNKELSAEEAAPLVREALVRRYELRPEDLREREGDPIRWACDEWEAYKRFEQIVGESRVLPPMEVSGKDVRESVKEDAGGDR